MKAWSQIAQKKLSGFAAPDALIDNMGHAVTDSELLAASIRGEHAAFGQLVTKYQALVCAVGFSGTRDAGLAEEVAQEAFVAAWRNLGQLRETSRFRSWLCGIARNLARQASRRARREVPDEVALECAVADGDSPFDNASDAETSALVQRALTRIPERYREALVLYYQQERSVRDVAEILGISQDAAMQRLSRGRNYLAEHMAIVVEHSLERSRPARNLAPRVLAVITPLGLPLPHGSPPLPNPPWFGATPKFRGSMLKLLLGISAALGAAGVTVYATQKDHASTVFVDGKLDRPSNATALLPQVAPANGTATPALLTQPLVAAGSPSANSPNTVEALVADSKLIDDATLRRLNIYHGPSRGPADAPVTIVVFDDLQCLYCAKVLATIDQIWEDYPNKLRLVSKQFPLPGHEHAQLAAEATLAAAAQGKYWEFHDLALASQEDLSRATLDGVARQVGLDVARFAHDLDTHAFAADVATDTATATTLEVHAAPSFIINGHLFAGAWPVEAFRAVIDAELGPRQP